MRARAAAAEGGQRDAGGAFEQARARGDQGSCGTPRPGARPGRARREAEGPARRGVPAVSGRASAAIRCAMWARPAWPWQSDGSVVAASWHGSARARTSVSSAVGAADVIVQGQGGELLGARQPGGAVAPGRPLHAVDLGAVRPELRLW